MVRATSGGLPCNLKSGILAALALFSVAPIAVAVGGHSMRRTVSKVIEHKASRAAAAAAKALEEASDPATALAAKDLDMVQLQKNSKKITLHLDTGSFKEPKVDPPVAQLKEDSKKISIHWDTSYPKERKLVSAAAPEKQRARVEGAAGESSAAGGEGQGGSAMTEEHVDTSSIHKAVENISLALDTLSSDARQPALAPKCLDGGTGRRTSETCDQQEMQLTYLQAADQQSFLTGFMTGLRLCHDVCATFDKAINDRLESDPDNAVGVQCKAYSVEPLGNFQSRCALFAPTVKGRSILGDGGPPLPEGGLKGECRFCS